MLVTRRLGEENTPEIISNKIRRKVKELAEMCGVTLPQQEANDAAQPVPAHVAEPAPAEQQGEPVVDDVVEHLPEDDYDADETWQHDNGEEFKEVFTLDYEEPAHGTPGAAKVPVEDREPDDDITVEFIEAPDDAPDEPEQPAVTAEPTAPAPADHVEEPAPARVQPPVFRMPVDTSDEPVPDPDPAILPEMDDEPDITVEFIEAEDAPVPEPENEMPLPPVPTDFPEVEDEPAPVMPLRVDEKLQRTLSRDIRKAFSLNDRFRFQRELFAGSASAMDTAIEHIKMMRTYGNAELYFYSQLNWDRENEVVKDFMAIVRNHFDNK